MEASRRGHEVTMCPNTAGCYFDYKHQDSEEEMGNLGVSTLRQVAAFSCTPDSMDAQTRANVLGSMILIGVRHSTLLIVESINCAMN